MKTFTWLGLFFLSALFASAQSAGDFHVVKTVNGNIVNFTVDNLGFIYLLSSDNQLKKIGTDGDSIGVFNDVKRYGKLYSMDVSNPLKVLLFYKDFSTIVVLDRFLSTVNVIDLRRQGIFQTRAIAQSFDNNIWVFDEQESKLKKIGEDGSILSETTDLRLVFDTAPSPVKIIDQDKFVYLYDPAKGMYIFDYYGALKNQIRLLGWKDVQVIGKNIVGRDEHNFYSYELGTLNMKQRVLPGAISKAEKIRIMPQAVYVLGDSGLQVYAYQ
jgi:hypothetical protein